ncbi:prepilin peptidase [Vibrio tubiashii]|uniref:A24 family peptidase n=1 Tax=Vibrio tubiashii TaxID=29498 RepID=UPI001EFCC592|nr:prepilin peptidase [Vibrio tubiashii]MCG9582865.1 prepilin peptidase [Vibrio tubiashii]MCG9616459.1 prepilin peptidase [Vibrio tubiashii]MCG9686964.1 prepilin peptidase [Vibrio tubiashii]
MSYKLEWLILLATLSLFAIYIDINERKISNRVCFLIAIVSFGYAYLYSEVQIISPVIILLVGLLLSQFNILGGGDSKLFGAYSIAIEPQVLPIALITICLVGSLVSLAYLIKKMLSRNTFSGIPYGIAISAGGLVGIVASM